MIEIGPQTQNNALQGGLSGPFVEFEHLPWLLDYLGEPGRPGPDWEDVLAEIRYGMDKEGVEWMDGLPARPMVERPLAGRGGGRCLAALPAGGAHRRGGIDGFWPRGRGIDGAGP